MDKHEYAALLNQRAMLILMMTRATSDVEKIEQSLDDIEDELTANGWPHIDIDDLKEV